MSGRIVNPVIVLPTNVLIKGHGLNGEEVEVEFFVPRSTDPETITIVEEWEDTIIYNGASAPIAFKSNPRELFLNIDSLRLLEGEDGKVWEVRVVQPE